MNKLTFLAKKIILPATISACLFSFANAHVSQVNSSTNISAVETEGFDGHGNIGGQGKLLLSAINSATTSLDITIYELNANDVNQAIANALSRGVNVRIIFNGSYSGITQYQNVQAVQAALKAAKPGPDGKLGKFELNWSSNNFQITHAKYILIDAADQNGQPLTELASNSKLIISTGNFSDYNTQKWYTARDFELEVTNAAAIEQAENVFISDFNCDGLTTTNNLIKSSPLVWSNGATGANASDPASAYPSKDEGYPNDQNLSANTVIQGNARDTMYNIINSAQTGDTLYFYNEEIYDPSTSGENINNALKNAAKKGVNVEIIMANSQSFMNDLVDLQAAGCKIHLITDSPTGVTMPYIHAKVVSLIPGSQHTVPASQTIMYIGSTNDSGSSMDMNRELGIALNSNDSSTINTINMSFTKDWQLPSTPPSTQNNTSGISQMFLSEHQEATKDTGTKSDSFTTQSCGPVQL